MDRHPGNKIRAMRSLTSSPLSRRLFAVPGNLFVGMINPYIIYIKLVFV